MPAELQEQRYYVKVAVALDGGRVDNGRTVTAPVQREDYERLQREFKATEGRHDDGKYSAIIQYPVPLAREALQKHLPSLRILELEEMTDPPHR